MLSRRNDVRLARRVGQASAALRVHHRQIPTRPATRLLEARLDQILFAIIQVDGALVVSYTSTRGKSLSERTDLRANGPAR
jgi:hypothetical protein